jgi:ankyrin repeat protein
MKNFLLHSTRSVLKPRKVLEYKQSYLRDLIFKNDVVKTKELLRDEDIDLYSVDETGNLPLHHAVENATPEMVDELLSAGAPLYEKNTRGVDVLRIASGRESSEMLTFLLEKGKYLYSDSTHAMFARCMCFAIINKRLPHFNALWAHKNNFFGV